MTKTAAAAATATAAAATAAAATAAKRTNTMSTALFQEAAFEATAVAADCSSTARRVDIGGESGGEAGEEGRAQTDVHGPKGMQQQAGAQEGVYPR
eukprot:6194848-Pleurochrysis_carterae.AAC.2